MVASENPGRFYLRERLMKRCAILSVVVILAFIAVPVSHLKGQDDAPVPSLDARIDQFWNLWEHEQPSEALRRLSLNPQNPWSNLYPVVDDFHSRLGGKCLGHVQIERKKVTDRVVFVSFYAYYDVQPFRVELLYYKARDRWEGIACHVDNNAALWLHEIGHPQEAATVPAGQDAQPQGGHE